MQDKNGYKHIYSISYPNKNSITIKGTNTNKNINANTKTNTNKSGKTNTIAITITHSNTITNTNIITISNSSEIKTGHSNNNNKTLSHYTKQIKQQLRLNNTLAILHFCVLQAFFTTTSLVSSLDFMRPQNFNLNL